VVPKLDKQLLATFGWFLLLTLSFGGFLALLCTPGCVSHSTPLTMDGFISVAPLPTGDIAPDQALNAVEIAGTPATDWTALYYALGTGGSAGAGIIALRIIRNYLRSHSQEHQTPNDQ